MHINFHETYQSLPTSELLNIVKQANDYQPDAVLAAIALLKERTITDADHREADQILADKNNNRMDEKKYLQAASTKIADLLEPIVNPETNVNARKWINLVIVALGIYSAWVIIHLVMRWRRLSELNHTDYFSAFAIFQPLFLVVTIAGLYLRKKWGWRLLMIFFVLQTISSAMGIYLSFKYPFFIAETVSATLMYGGAIYFLSRHPIRIYFNISDYYLRNTFFAAIIFYLLIQVFAPYFS